MVQHASDKILSRRKPAGRNRHDLAFQDAQMLSHRQSDTRPATLGKHRDV